jgi:hypothetical protein
MGFFTPQTKVVEIDEDNRVTIRKLTYAERQACISKAMRVTQEAKLRGRGKGQQAKPALPDESAEILIDPALMAAEQVKACLVSWEGPGFEGRPATGDNLMALPPAIVDLIAAAADDLNAGLSDEEKNP